MSKIIKFYIPGRLPGLNEYTKANRGNKYAANKLKQETEELIMWHLPKIKMHSVQLIFTWYEKNTRRDKDNIAFAKKFIMDAIVKAGILENDGWKQVISFEDRFEIDKDNPRVEVEMIEMEGQK